VNVGKKISKSSKRCRGCKVKETIKKQENSTIESILVKDSHAKFNRVRLLARAFMKYYGIKKECKICKFDICVEIAHIKPISEFTLDSLIGEVNSLNNIIYLCPNHHKMLDKKLISLEEYIVR